MGAASAGNHEPLAGADPRMPDRRVAPAFGEDRHWVSPFNFDAGIRDGYRFPNPLRIYDSTLRKILLTPGVSPPIVELLKIAEGLEQAGVREVVLNVHWWGDQTPNRREVELCRAVHARGFAFHTTVFAEAALPSPANSVMPSAALDVIRDLGAQTVELPTFQSPATPAQADESIAMFAEACRYAQSIGLETVLGIGDAGRADFDFMIRLANVALDLGCTRISLLDSYSSMSVDAMRLFCSTFRARLTRPAELSMHVHNDFGMGTALAIAAACAGVNPDVSVNSVSYRSGLAALQEVVTALEFLYDVRTGIRTTSLQSLAKLVAGAVDAPGDAFRPLTGAHAFLRDDPEGMLAYMLDGPDAFPIASSCINPGVVGGATSIVWGDRHATSTVRAKLHQLGLSDSDALVAAVYQRIEQAVNSKARYPRWLTEREVEALCREVAAELAIMSPASRSDDRQA